MKLTVSARPALDNIHNGPRQNQILATLQSSTYVPTSLNWRSPKCEKIQRPYIGIIMPSMPSAKAGPEFRTVYNIFHNVSEYEPTGTQYTKYIKYNSESSR